MAIVKLSNSPMSPYELAYEYVLRTNRCIFLTGKAGTGKTTLLRRLAAVANLPRLGQDSRAAQAKDNQHTQSPAKQIPATHVHSSSHRQWFFSSRCMPAGTSMTAFWKDAAISASLIS